jgi:hypothetical protein
MSLASRFVGKGKTPKRGKAKSGGMDQFKRTYGAKDGKTVFDASQIKARRKGKKR